VFELARARRLPILLVTHDPSDARAAGGRLLELASPKTVDNASRT
jgi:putative thiamine transport system ATP-binding protein